MIKALTLRVGLVVHRESIPLSDLGGLRRGALAAGGPGREGANDYVIRMTDRGALFGVKSSDESIAVVSKGSVEIKEGNAEIAYRASVGATIFLVLWFGLLIAGEVGYWFLAPPKPLAPALVGVAMMVGSALLVRRAIRVEVAALRGIALEAVTRLQDNPPRV